MSPWRPHPAVSALVIVLLTLLAYMPSMRGGFIWDDDDYVANNPVLPASDGLPRIWLEPRATPQYYPLVFTTFWVEYRLWGLDPLGYKIVNVLLHAASALMLWRLLRGLGLSQGLAWSAAAVFALHPINVESVAWITERKNVLAGALAFATLLAWGRFDPFHGAPSVSPSSSPSPAPAPSPSFPPAGPRSRWRWYALALMLFTLALLSKSVTCAVPAVILVLVWWKRGRWPWREALVLLPFFALGLTAGLHTAHLEQQHVGALGPDWDFSPAHRLLIAGRAAWFYLGKLLWPAPLAFIYPRWTLDPASVTQWTWPVAAVAAVLALIAGIRRGLGRGPLAATLIFLGVLVPALGFFNVYPMLYSFVADHFQYLAAPAMIALLLVAGDRLLHRLPARLAPAPLRPLAMAILLASLATLTWRQGHAYRDLETLWRDTLARNPASWMAWNNLGHALHQQGRDAEAVKAFESSLAIRPQHASALTNMGVALAALGQHDQAIAAHQRAIVADPTMVEVLLNLGRALTDLGRFDHAQLIYQRALGLAPRRADVHFGHATMLAQAGRTDQAVAAYEHAIALQPHYADARNNLGNLLLQLGRNADAQAQFRQALADNPRSLPTLNNLGYALALAGHDNDALAYFQRALLLDPHAPQVRLNLAMSLGRLRRFPEALAEVDAVLARHPADPAALQLREALQSMSSDNSTSAGSR